MGVPKGVGTPLDTWTRFRDVLLGALESLEPDLYSWSQLMRTLTWENTEMMAFGSLGYPEPVPVHAG